MPGDIGEDAQAAADHHGRHDGQAVEPVGQVDRIRRAHDHAESEDDEPERAQRIGHVLEEGHDQVVQRGHGRCVPARGTRRQPGRPPTARRTWRAPRAPSDCGAPPCGSRPPSRSRRTRRVTSSTTQRKRLERSPHSSVVNPIDEQDQRAAHGRRAGLGEVRLRTVVAHRLADLVGGELADHQRAEDQRDRERGEAGEHRAQRDVVEHVEQRACPSRASGPVRAASVRSPFVVPHSAATMRSMCMKREPLTRIVVPASRLVASASSRSSGVA